MPKDVRAEFDRATALHREGRLDEAVEIYRRLLKGKPAVFEIQRLLVLALLQAGRVRDAHAAARKAREAHPSNAHSHLLLGAALQAEAKWERALSAFEAAAVLDPGLVEAHYLAGNMLANLDRHAEAAARFDRALAIDPRAVEALANRAVAWSRLGRAEEALRDCERLAELQPWDPRHFLSKGAMLLGLGRYREATEAAEAALRLAPNLPDAHYLKGQGLAGQADVAGARGAFAGALTGAPDRPVFQAALARAERQLGNHAAARTLCEAALARNPAAAQVRQELAEVERELADLEGARAASDGVPPADPAAPADGLAKARLLADLGRPEEARPLVEPGLAVDPDLPMALYRRALDDLAAGRWAEGWAGYENRAAVLPQAHGVPPFARWDGREVPDALIVLGEEGLGDLIQFGRLLRILADRGIPARLLTDARHVPLLSRIDARIPVIADLPAADAACPGLRWVPLASLPGLIAPDPATWPAPPYMPAMPERIARWRELRTGAFLVGIAWQGVPSPALGRGSVPLESFAPLAGIPGVTLVSLQQGPAVEQLDTCSFSDRIERLGPDWDGEGTFLDTAALLQHLDLVVTTDNPLAHLAGARNRPAFVVLPAAADWPWGRGGQTTPLYPSLHLVREERPGDPAGALARIAELIRSRMAEVAA